MSGADPRLCGISTVHLWAHDALIEAVDNAPWLVKHYVPATRGSILQQMLWQHFCLPKEARRAGINAMFNTDAGSICTFRPAMTLSQDMLSFEPGEIQRYPWLSKARIRLEILGALQLHRLGVSSLALFLTEHARKVIGGRVPLGRSGVVSHGINGKFYEAGIGRRDFPEHGPVRCLYVSNAAPYKHQWHVVAAIARLREKSGLDLRLRLVGGGGGPAMKRLREAIDLHDPNLSFVDQAPFVPNDQIIDELRAADLFIFASSCENLPITLLEAMAAGLPIASSNRGPMPEVLGNAGKYFNPECPDSIALSIEQLIIDRAERDRCAGAAREMSLQYTWENCARETWSLLSSISKKFIK
jgi:glycosyltransferase involved in cell wall biosynthesis